MSNKRLYMMIAILFLVVGVGALSTSVYLTGVLGIRADDDFSVYFSKAVINDEQDNSVITSPTKITFYANLDTIGETYTLEYDVTNGSKRYDASVSVNCTDSTANLSINNSFDTSTNLGATETRTGTLTLKYTSSVTEETTLSIKCELSATEVERTTIADGIPASQVVLIPVTATDSSGKNLNATSYAITGTTKDTLLEKLVESGNITSADEVDALIEVESDDFDDLATTTFDVSSIASNGDTVVILHYNETTQEWEYITEATVTDGKVTGDFTSYSPVAFVIKKSDGTYQTVEQTIDLYNMIKSNASTDVIDFSKDSGVSGTNGIYTTTETDSGNAVYYYRGNVDNNLIFNNMCWKIMRTTETGGIKLIYNGTPVNNQCTTQTGSTTSIGSSSFNEGIDNAYVGYMYGNTGAETFEETHKNTNDSLIKIFVDNWYSKNFTNSSITNQIEDTVYCNDRSGFENAFGTHPSDYAAYFRVSWFISSPSPTLKCALNNDKFTVSTDNGNGALTYPVGLITLDEAVFAGAFESQEDIGSADNKTNYLYSGEMIWTMTPLDQRESGTYAAPLAPTPASVSDLVSSQYDVRPVISLKSGTTIGKSGLGTTTNPYIVK